MVRRINAAIVALQGRPVKTKMGLKKRCPPPKPDLNSGTGNGSPVSREPKGRHRTQTDQARSWRGADGALRAGALEDAGGRAVDECEL